MTIEQTLQIRAKHDTCSVTRLPSGRISFGSAVIAPDEVDDFCAAIRKAADQLPKVEEPTPVPAT